MIVLPFGFRLRAVAPPASEPLVLHWKFDESSGTTAVDSSPSGLDGTLDSMSGSEWEAGKHGNGLHFDGAEDRVDYADISGVVDLTAEWTVMGWVNFDTKSSYMAAIGFTDGTDTEGLRLGVGGSGGANVKMISKGETPSEGSALAAGEWHHLAMSWDGSVLRAYLDGVFDYSSTPTGTNWQSCTKFTVGAKHYSYDWFDGLVDDVRLYSTQLSESEIYDASVDFGPLIGPETIGGSQVGLGNTKAWMQKFVMPEDGDVSKLTAYVSLSSGSGDLKGLLYNHDGGTDKPSTLIATATPTALTGDGVFRWYGMTFSSPVSLTSGTTYWMGFTPSVTINTKYAADSTYRVVWNTNIGSYASPSTISPSSGTYLNGNGLSLYATY